MNKFNGNINKLNKKIIASQTLAALAELPAIVGLLQKKRLVQAALVQQERIILSR